MIEYVFYLDDAHEKKMLERLRAMIDDLARLPDEGKMAGIPFKRIDPHGRVIDVDILLAALRLRRKVEPHMIFHQQMEEDFDKAIGLVSQTLGIIPVILDSNWSSGMNGKVDDMNSGVDTGKEEDDVDSV